MKNKKKILTNLIFIIGIGVGLILLLYPIYEARFVEKAKFNRKINEFDEKLNYDNRKDVQKTTSSLNLSLAKSDVVGVIYIPKIDLGLPIYYGIDETSLSEGAGTMIEYGLPNGQLNTHAVITSHSGLSSSGLFSNINKMEIGDDYYIKNSNGIIQQYVVTNIITIEPTDFTRFGKREDKAFTTLLTCTPIGINSHRLLVQGVKVKDFVDIEKAKVDIKENTRFTLSDYEVKVISVFVIFLLLYLITRLVRIYKKGDAFNEKKNNDFIV